MRERENKESGGADDRPLDENQQATPRRTVDGTTVTIS